ncbi:hypothetical protein Cgig2_018839 [Carnegiea gigantea]|uniref:Uncharacterized protein n=1 Tax=Carnegiea gigantea TaxID=171969 RepID=A0A9Q1KIF3_9CARY|nr:hypothetical protein Cgig2_018839 [Carnegiea gigantea]
MDARLDKLRDSQQKASGENLISINAQSYSAKGRLRESVGKHNEKQTGGEGIDSQGMMETVAVPIPEVVPTVQAQETERERERERTRKNEKIGVPVLTDWSGHFLMLGYYTFLSSYIDPLIRPLINAFPSKMKFQWNRYLEAWKYGAGLDYTL